jgi:hypothetical protein
MLSALAHSFIASAFSSELRRRTEAVFVINGQDDGGSFFLERGRLVRANFFVGERIATLRVEMNLKLADEPSALPVTAGRRLASSGWRIARGRWRLSGSTSL